MSTPTITGASVRVLRSHDYCHFEISLSTQEANIGHLVTLPITTDDVDALRKEAARLADKAVEQYKVAKREWENIESDVYALERLKRAAKDAEAKPESERTPYDKAAIKKLKDREHWQRRNYDYNDDWEYDDGFLVVEESES